MPISEERSWRLPAVTIAAGALLALLAILLAWWSKGLLKDTVRADCAARSSAIAQAVNRDLEIRVNRVRAALPRPAEVAAAHWLRAGKIERSDPADAAPPPAAFLAASAARNEQRVGELGEDGALAAATWVPDERTPERGVLVVWDLAAVEANLIRPRLVDDTQRYAALLVRKEQDPASIPFRVRAETALFPPLSAWRVAIGLRDPSAVRRNLRLQTALLGLLAGWLLVALAGSVLLYTRRERRRATELRAREQFLARAYHELQTPLALMRAAAESLQRGAVERPEDLSRCVDIVTREEERLTRTVRRLLRYLRLQSAAGAVGEPTPLRREVEGAIEDARPSFEAQGVRLELELDGLVEGFLAPGELVADTVRELLANARKYADGASRVRVDVRAVADGARIVVEDDGPGVGDDPELIFAPWERREEGPRAAGSGLGLALLREGWDAAGGAIRCEPVEGGGARFVVEVPAP